MVRFRDDEAIKSKETSSGFTKHHRTNVVNISSETEEEYSSVLTINSSSHHKPVYVPVKLQFDTGATVTLLSETTWNKIGNPTLSSPAVRLQSYCNDDILLLGSCHVNVECCNKSCKLPIVVAKGDRLDLLGRSWIVSLKLDLYHINQVSTTESVTS